jgi:hypothetical protein
VSVGQLDDIGYKINIDTGMIKIQEPDGVLLAKVKWEANRLYLLHLKFTQPTCLAVCGRDDEVMWRWRECFRHVNMVALRKLAQEELVYGQPEIGQVGSCAKHARPGNNDALHSR